MTLKGIQKYQELKEMQFLPLGVVSRSLPALRISTLIQKFTAFFLFDEKSWMCVHFYVKRVNAITRHSVVAFSSKKACSVAWENPISRHTFAKYRNRN